MFSTILKRKNQEHYLHKDRCKDHTFYCFSSCPLTLASKPATTSCNSTTTLAKEFQNADGFCIYLCFHATQYVFTNMYSSSIQSMRLARFHSLGNILLMCMNIFNNTINSLHIIFPCQYWWF